MKRRWLLFLYGAPNIVGCLLGLAGLGLYFAGVIHDYWLPIVLGLYAGGWLITPRRADRQLRLTHELDTEALRASLDELLASIRRQVPADILARTQRITETILEVLPRLGEFDGGSHNTHVIRQTALDYLPTALQNYLALPSAFARLHPLRDGKTAHQILLEQLDLLDGKMREIAADIHRQDSQQLLIHGRFLEDKFRDGQEWLAGG
ncbi:MAG: hypothetical protein KDJ31_12515 [Candidatus Competibacteraceae bacterium]|nr:hypothetical protein [Candidatus Competibacteraceae bacterium]MCB1821975.1 hypothetical protein [Candidatus Competibacteraceae bacterium]